MKIEVVDDRMTVVSLSQGEALELIADLVSQVQARVDPNGRRAIRTGDLALRLSDPGYGKSIRCAFAIEDGEPYNTKER